MESTTGSSSASVSSTSPALPVPQPPSTATNVSDPAAGALVPRNEVNLTGEAGTETDIPASAFLAKKCNSDVWEHYTKYEKKKEGSDGKMITEYWAKCNKCRYESRCESVRGTSVFWNHLANKHQIKGGQQLLKLMKSGDDSNTASIETYRLEGKVALVTGGATGIGEAIVRLFRQHGAKVCISDVQDEAGQQVCDSLGGDPDVLFVHCDVTVEEDVSRAVDATAEKFGTLDIMVNNAGITGNKITDIRNTDFAEVRKVFDINVHGVFLGMKHAARIMIPNKKGSIISLASVACVIGGMGPHAYTASKHAVVGLTKNVAGELGRHGIRVNCVSPYAVPTGLSMPHLPQGERKDDALKDFLAFVGGEANLKGVDLLPKDVAEAVLYLASDEARYISALNLLVDGGFTAVNPNLRAFDD